MCDGRLYMGSMPNAVKAQDLQRDPRCCLITPLADKDDLAGEAEAVLPGPRDRRRRRVGARRGPRSSSAAGSTWATPGGSHVFELAIEGAAWQRVEGDDWRTTSLDARSAASGSGSATAPSASHDL